jgi:hypothetical protein
MRRALEGCVRLLSSWLGPRSSGEVGEVSPFLPCACFPQNEATARAQDWTVGMIGFDKVLSGLSEVTSQHTKGGDSSSSDSESDAPELPQKAAKSAPGKPAKDARGQKVDRSSTLRHTCDG